MALPRTHMSLVMPKSLIRSLKVLKSAKGNELFRNALKAAQRPPQASLKRWVRLLRNTSDQSTGATLRSIKTKVSFPGKTTPGRGYMLAGIDFEHYENHMSNTSATHARSGLKGKRRKYIGVTNRGRKAVGRGQRVSKKYVKSYQKSRLRLKKGQSTQRNRPGKYWHILESGWTNRRVKRAWSGYKFVQRAFKKDENTMFMVFHKNLEAGIAREFKK